MPVMMLSFLLLVTVKAGLSAYFWTVGAGAEVCWGASCSQRFLRNRDVQSETPLISRILDYYMGHLDLLGSGKDDRLTTECGRVESRNGRDNTVMLNYPILETSCLRTSSCVRLITPYRLSHFQPDFSIIVQ